MKKSILGTLLFTLLLPIIGSSQDIEQQQAHLKKFVPSAPILQLAGGLVYSNIDLSRYVNAVSYRGYHARIVTHVKGMFFISGEYCTFPVHDARTAWENIHTHKFDLNANISFSTNNHLTQIFVLAGLNRHLWTATRTGYTDVNQLGRGIPEGTIVQVDRLGMNFGCGFTQTLYENIGIFGDCRFVFANANSFEKVRIMDVMTTLGINFSIQNPSNNGKKTSHIDGKLYKWTRKGGKK